MESTNSLSEIKQYINTENTNQETLVNMFHSYYNTNSNSNLRDTDFIKYQMRIYDNNISNENLHTECPDYQLFDIERIKNKTVEDICNMSTGYGYGGGNEMGTKLSKEDITPHLSKCALILKLFQTERYEEITQLNWLQQYLKGTIFMKEKKNGIGYRPLTNAHPITKFLNRCLNRCIDTSNIPNNFLNFASKPDSEEKFMSVREIAVNHKFLPRDFIQLDISKAFDNVEHNYLKIVLEDLHIPPSVIKLIMYLMKNIKLNYNDKPMLIGKSIQQGVPFSHFLFGFVTLHQFQHIRKVLNLNNFKLGKDYLINWFVDDMIVYFYCNENLRRNAEKIFNHINDVLVLTGFTMSKNKCFSTKYVHFPDINFIREETRYLGLPYTKNKNIYLNDVNNEINNKYGINLYQFNKLLGKIPNLQEELTELVKSNKESPSEEKKVEIEEITSNLVELKDKKRRIMGKLNYILCGLYGCKEIYSLQDIFKFLDSHRYYHIADNLSLLDYKLEKPVKYSGNPEKIIKFMIYSTSIFYLIYMWLLFLTESK